MTSEKTFFDTNILVYSLDNHNAQKREKSRALMRATTQNRSGVISTQVMQEFYVVATKKLGLDPIDAKGLITDFENFEVVTITPAHIYDAVDCSVLSRVSFWDALIAVAAESAACSFIATEDLNSGQLIRGVRVQNPFQP